jgi:AcrR family transcriptional regulator
MSPASSADPPSTLRERKKTRTRFAIQQEALKLFRKQGYASTTVEQIADAAEVSPSTFFRYFPTKDSLVLTDDYDPIMLERFRAQPPELGVVAAFRAAFRQTFADVPEDQMQAAEERNALILAVPEIRAAFADFLIGSMHELSHLIAERSHRAANEPEVITVTGALLGVVLSALLLEGTDIRAKLDVLDSQLAFIETGFTI